MKKTVLYDAHMGVSLLPWGEWQRARLYPIDHPDTENVSNTTWCLTSAVQNYNETTGVIETLNTIYLPKERE